MITRKFLDFRIICIISLLSFFSLPVAKAHYHPQAENNSSNEIKKESHLYKLMVLTNDLVLNLDASDIDGAGNSADPSDLNTVWIDKSNMGNNGTLTNFTSLNPSSATSGWDGASPATVANPPVLKFDGLDDKVQLSVPLLSSTQDFTITAVINRSIDSTQDFISGNYGSSNSGGIEFYVRSTNKLSVYINGLVTGVTNINAGTWYHVAVTRLNGLITLYVNGIGESTGTLNNSIGTSLNFAVGNQPDNNVEAFGGKIANVRVYSTALTAEQIRQNYIAEAYKFQSPDNVAPGIFGDEDLRNQTSLTGGNLFDVYAEDTNPQTNGDNDVAAINSFSCSLEGQTLTNPTPTEQNFTSGLTFDGVDDHVGIPAFINPASLGDFTVEALVKQTAHNPNGRTYIVDFRGNGSATQNSFALLVDNVGGTTEVHHFIPWASGGFIEYAVPITSPIGKWTHYVLTRSGSTLSTYLNGTQLTNTFTPSSTPPKSDAASLANGARFGTWAGAAPGGNYWLSGTIAYVRLYNRALSATEIAKDKRFRSQPISPLGLIALWDFTESSGTTAAAKKWNSATNSIIPESSLNGTLTNFDLASARNSPYSYNINKYTFTVPTFTGPDQIENLICSASDVSGNTSSNEQVGSILIRRPPIINSPINITTDAGKFLSLQLTATDPNNSTITYGATGLPPGLSINAQTGLVSGTPLCTNSGVTNYQITWQATGTNGVTSTITSQISIACNLLNVVVVPFISTTTSSTQTAGSTGLTGTGISTGTLPTASEEEPNLGINTTGEPDLGINSANQEIPTIIPLFPNVSPALIASLGIDTAENNNSFVYPGFPTVFKLEDDSDLVKETSQGGTLSASIKDSNGKVFPLSLNQIIGGPSSLKIDLIPDDIALGAATIDLLINNETKAKINVLVIEKGIKDYIPKILKVQVIKHKNNLKLIIKGKNFSKRWSKVDNERRRRLAVSILPGEGLKLKKLFIWHNRRVVIVKYKIKDKNIKGEYSLVVANPNGQDVTEIEIP